MKNELEGRTKRFALDVIALVGNLSRSSVSDVLGHQLLKSGTSIGANYSTCEIENGLRLRSPIYSGS